MQVNKSHQRPLIRCPSSRIIDNMVRYGLAYQRQTEADELAAHRARMEKNLRRRAKEMGYELHKIEPPPKTEATAEVPVA